MTRKDYAALADIINAQLASKRDSMGDPDDLFLGTVRAVADYCQHDNPRFDRARFMIAAGVPR